MKAKIISACLSIATGLIVLALFVDAIKESKHTKQMSYPELERTLDEETCKAAIINAVVLERIRLTGRPNP